MTVSLEWSQEGGHRGSAGIGAKLEGSESENPCLGKQRGQSLGQRLRNSGNSGGVAVGGGGPVAEFTEDTGSEDGNLQLATNNSKERRHWLVLTPPPTYTLVLCSCVCH